MNDSIKLARLWSELARIEAKINNEILPAAGYLEIEDEELMLALENAAARIADHFAKYRLVTKSRK